MKFKLLITSLFIVISLFPPSTSHAYMEEHIPVSAQTAILMEQESGRVLFGKDVHEQRRIASITKIMTAILAIESGTMDEIVTVSKKAAYTEGSSIYLKPGEKIVMADLVYGLMLKSGNDAAVAIAEHIGGSVEGFVFLMNERAKEIGMTNSRFANPHGLDDHEHHYSTAYDMAILTQYAMKNETFRDIFGTKTYRSKDRVWTNKNRLLTQLYEPTTGGKTGFTKRAGRTLVTTAEKNGMELICVTIDAPSDWNDHIKLYEWGFSEFSLEKVVEKGPLTAERGDGQVMIPYDYYYPLRQAEKRILERKIILDKGHHGSQSDVVGKLELSLHQQLIHAMPLYLEKKAEPKGLFQRLSEFMRNILR